MMEILHLCLFYVIFEDGFCLLQFLSSGAEASVDDLITCIMYIMSNLSHFVFINTPIFPPQLNAKTDLFFKFLAFSLTFFNTKFD